jgi:hypothetical protein
LGLVLFPSKFQVFSLSLSITSIFGRMHGALNVGKKKLIAQFGSKSRDESFEPN